MIGELATDDHGLSMAIAKVDGIPSKLVASLARAHAGRKNLTQIFSRPRRCSPSAERGENGF
jgi:hypothetical protein